MRSTRSPTPSRSRRIGGTRATWWSWRCASSPGRGACASTITSRSSTTSASRLSWPRRAGWRRSPAATTGWRSTPPTTGWRSPCERRELTGTPEGPALRPAAEAHWAERRWARALLGGQGRPLGVLLLLLLVVVVFVPEMPGLRLLRLAAFDAYQSLAPAAHSPRRHRRHRRGEPAALRPVAVAAQLAGPSRGAGQRGAPGRHRDGHPDARAGPAISPKDRRPARRIGPRGGAEARRHAEQRRGAGRGAPRPAGGRGPGRGRVRGLRDPARGRPAPAAGVRR